MQMPGYQEKQQQIQAEKAKEQKLSQQKAEKMKHEQEEMAAKKLEKEKKEIIENNLPTTSFWDFYKTFMINMGWTFVAGSVMWFLSRGPFDDKGNRIDDKNVLSAIYQPDLTYAQAIKNAYLWGGVRTNRSAQDYIQAIAGVISICIAAMGAAKNMMGRTDKVYKYVEMLKQRGLSMNQIKLIQQYCDTDIISKMSKKDRGYIENLLNGGLDKVGYEIASAIVEGYLIAHPNDYENIIKIIDAHTLPDYIHAYAARNVRQK